MAAPDTVTVFKNRRWLHCLLSGSNTLQFVERIKSDLFS